MKKQINTTIKAHLTRSALYLLLLLAVCAIPLALAQQPVEQQSPSKNKHASEKAHPAEAHPNVNEAQPHAPAATQQHGAMKEHGVTHQPAAMKEHGATTEHAATNEPGAGTGQKAPVNEESAAVPKTTVSGESCDTSTSARQQRIEQRRKGMKGPAAAAKTSTNPAAPPAAAGGAP